MIVHVTLACQFQEIPFWTHLLVYSTHFVAPKQTIQWPFDFPFDGETSPFRIDIFHPRIKVIPRNNFVLICSDPSHQVQSSFIRTSWIYCFTLIMSTVWTWNSIQTKRPKNGLGQTPALLSTPWRQQLKKIAEGTSADSSLKVYLQLSRCWNVSRVLGSHLRQKLLSGSLMELSIKKQRERERGWHCLRLKTHLSI